MNLHIVLTLNCAIPSADHFVNFLIVMLCIELSCIIERFLLGQKSSILFLKTRECRLPLKKV